MEHRAFGSHVHPIPSHAGSAAEKHNFGAGGEPEVPCSSANRDCNTFKIGELPDEGNPRLRHQRDEATESMPHHDERSHLWMRFEVSAERNGVANRGVPVQGPRQPDRCREV
jgi:hypothetical protein